MSAIASCLSTLGTLPLRPLTRAPLGLTASFFLQQPDRHRKAAPSVRKRYGRADFSSHTFEPLCAPGSPIQTLREIVRVFKHNAELEIWTPCGSNRGDRSPVTNTKRAPVVVFARQVETRAPDRTQVSPERASLLETSSVVSLLRANGR